jgi:hypothetical protein
LFGGIAAAPGGAPGGVVEGKADGKAEAKGELRVMGVFSSDFGDEHRQKKEEFEVEKRRVRRCVACSCCCIRVCISSAKLADFHALASFLQRAAIAERARVAGGRVRRPGAKPGDPDEYVEEKGEEGPPVRVNLLLPWLSVSCDFRGFLLP